MRSEPNNLFVISGTAGSGKTTVLRVLAELGLKCVPEVAREIIQEQMRAGGPALPWDDREAYISMMLRRSIESYQANSTATEPVFFDRGIPDTLGYARFIASPQEADALSACRELRYSTTVFLAPPWQQIYATDNERMQDFAETVLTFEPLRKVYEECGYEICLLPKLEPEARAAFLLGQLGL